MNSIIVKQQTNRSMNRKESNNKYYKMKTKSSNSSNKTQ